MRRKVVLGLSICFLLMAFFKAWHDQRSAAKVQGQEIAQLKTQLTDLIKADFHIEFISLLTGPKGKGSNAILVLKVSNFGAPAAALAESWRLEVKTDNGTYLGTPKMIDADNGTYFCFGNTGKMRKFFSEDALEQKASHVIERNGYTQGALMFDVSDVSNEKLNDDATSFIVSVEDVRHEIFSSSKETIASPKNKSREGYISGLKYPYLIPSNDCVSK